MTNLTRKSINKNREYMHHSLSFQEIYTDIIKNNGKNLISSEYSINIVDKHKKSLLMYFSRIYCNSRGRPFFEKNALEYVISNEIDVNMLDENELSALHHAIMDDPKLEPFFPSVFLRCICVADCETDFESARFKEMRNEIVEILLSAPDINVNIKNKNGETPLILAIQKNMYDISKQLIQAGANINLPDNEGNTPLIWAVRYVRYAFVKLLSLHKPELDIKNLEGKSAIHYAIIQNCSNTALKLKIEGAALNLDEYKEYRLDYVHKIIDDLSS